jgi:hypothetical protein
MLLVGATVPDLPQSIWQVDSSRSAPSNLDGRFANKRVTGLARMQSLPSIEFIAMPPNPALNRTGRHAASIWFASARPAG